jgi:predicted extracellular nuclease
MPRVTVNAVVQEGAATTYINPNTGLPETLNDRPPLRLDGIVNDATGGAFPVTVIVNHLRSLNGIASETPDGSGTEGARVRAKRAAQADFLADLVQARQTASPGERIMLVGDFNAFEFNDGYVDSMGAITGTPSPADEVVAANSDLVNPDLTNLAGTEPPDQRYSYSFDGNAQSLDHVVVNQALVAATYDWRLRHPRIDADFPETARNNSATPTRLSDHDALVAYIDAFAATDVIFRDGFQSGP